MGHWGYMLSVNIFVQILSCDKLVFLSLTVGIDQIGLQRNENMGESMYAHVSYMYS